MWLVLNRAKTPKQKDEDTLPMHDVASGRQQDGAAGHQEAATLLAKPSFSTAPPPGASSSACSWPALVAMVAVISTICSIDRMCMSVAILPISEQYRWPDSTKGAVSAAFSVGYTLTNLLGGWLAAVHGPKLVLHWGVAVWSLFTLLTPPATATGQLWLLLLVRAVMGLGEGVTFPCVQVLIKTCTPADKRARSLSLVYSGHQLGSVISLLLSPPIILRWGWPWVFFIYGSLGFFWLGGWQPLVLPVTNSGSTAAGSTPLATGGELLGKEKAGGVDYASGEKGSGKGLGLETWRLFAQQPACWALLTAHCCFGVAYNVAMGWLPTYYNQALGVDVWGSAWLSVLPFLCMAVTTNGSGWVADCLVNSGTCSTIKARKLLQTMGTLLPSCCLWWLAGVQGKESGLTAAQALALLSVFLGGLGCCSAGFASNHTDLATRLAGLLYGITNAGSSLAGSVAVYGVGVALEATGGDWGQVFSSVAWCSVVSCAVFDVWGSSTPMFE